MSVSEPDHVEPEPVSTVDLSGRTCPESFVEAKLALEELESGQRLKVIVSDAESARRIPENMENHGQEVVRCEAENDIWQLVIERRSSEDRNRWVMMD